MLLIGLVAVEVVITDVDGFKYVCPWADDRRRYHLWSDASGAKVNAPILPMEYA